MESIDLGIALLALDVLVYLHQATLDWTAEGHGFTTVFDTPLSSGEHGFGHCTADLGCAGLSASNNWKYCYMGQGPVAGSKVTCPITPDSDS